MRMRRIYTHSLIQHGETLTLTETAAHHVKHVLRAKPGEQFYFFNGQGGHALGEITSLSKRDVTVSILSVYDTLGASTLKLHLGQALISGPKFELVLQKATELGVDEITPLVTQHTTQSLPPAKRDKKLQHWHGVLAHACEQCYRDVLPRLNPPMAFPEWINGLDNAVPKFILNPEHGTSLNTQTLTQHAILMIGPEGGWHEDELALAGHFGVTPIQLGPRILRAETAAVAALTGMQLLFGDMR